MSPGILLVALLTPFTPQVEADAEALQANVADLRAADLDGLFKTLGGVRQRLTRCGAAYPTSLRPPFGVPQP